jgi:hypothetical protein
MVDKGNHILDGISEDEWKEIYRDLVSYAVFQLKIYSVNNDTHGLNAQDFVGRVVTKVLSIGKKNHRVWDPVKNPDKVKFFKGCLSSEISNHFKSSRFKTSVDKELDTEYNFFDSIGTDTNILDEVDATIFKDKLIEALFQVDEKLVEVLFLLEEDRSVEDIAKNLAFKNSRQVRYAITKIRNITMSVAFKLGEKNE